MIYQSENCCEGCSRNCQYGYFSQGRNGTLYPMLDGQVIESYWASTGERKFILPGTLTSPSQALEKAREISLRCTRNMMCQQTR